MQNFSRSPYYKPNEETYPDPTNFEQPCHLVKSTGPDLTLRTKQNGPAYIQLLMPEATKPEVALNFFRRLMSPELTKDAWLCCDETQVIGVFQYSKTGGLPLELDESKPLRQELLRNGFLEKGSWVGKDNILRVVLASQDLDGSQRRKLFDGAKSTTG